jgi:hypothetical protein
MWPLSILYSMRNYPRWARRIAARKVNVNCRTNTCKLIKPKRNGWLNFFFPLLQSCCHENVLKNNKEEYNLNFHCCEILRPLPSCGNSPELNFSFVRCMHMNIWLWGLSCISNTSNQRGYFVISFVFSIWPFLPWWIFSKIEAILWVFFSICVANVESPLLYFMLHICPCSLFHTLWYQPATGFSECK